MFLVEKIKNKSQLKELFNYSLWSIVGTVVSKFSLLLIWIFVARILSVNTYGEFAIIRNTVLLFSEFVGVSLMIAATKYVAESVYDKKLLQKIIGNLFFICFILGIVLSIGFYLISDYLSVNMIKAPHLYKYISITAFLMLFVTLNKCQFGVMQGLGEFKLIAKINIIQVIFSFPFFYILTKCYGLFGAVLGYMFYNVIIWAVSCYFLHFKLKSLNIKTVIYPDAKTVKKILIYIIPYLGAVILAQFSAWYNEIRLVSLPSGGFSQMGNYTAVLTIQNTILSSIIVFCTPLVSLMAKYKNSNDKILVQLNYFMPLYLGIFFLIVAVLIPEILYIIYGSSYANEQVYQIVVIIALYTPIVIFKQSLARSVAVYEKQSIYFVDCIVMTIITIGGFYLFQSYGLLAMILSVVAANLISVLIFTPVYIHVKMIDGDLLSFKSVVLPFICFFALGLCYLVLRDYFIIRVLMVIVIYISIGIVLIRYVKK